MAVDGNKRFGTVLIERLALALEGVSDHQIHAVVDYDGPIDPERMARAHALSLEAEPVLGCRLALEGLNPHWERDGALRAKGFSVVEGRDDDLHRFLCTPLDARVSPQVFVRVFGTDRMCVKINHHIADAKGTKDYVYLLCDIYRRLGNDPVYAPRSKVDLSRGMEGICTGVGLSGAVRAAWLSLRDLGMKAGGIGWGNTPRAGGDAKARFSSRRIGPDTGRRIKAFARGKNATLNDIFMAAIYRAYYSAMPPPEGRPLRMISTADLRRYGREGDPGPVRGSFGFVYSGIGRRIGGSFDETLWLVKREFDKIKSLGIGLGDIPALAFILKALPFPLGGPLLGAAMGKVFRPGRVSGFFTNMGALSAEALSLGNAAPREAYLTAPLSYRPYFPITGISGFGDTFTVSSGLGAPDAGHELVNSILDNFASEILAVI